MEPQIKAKLVIDTSQLNGIQGSSGSPGGAGKGVATESTKLLKELVKGQLPVSSLANKLLGSIVGAGAGLGGLGAALGIGAGTAALLGGLKGLSSAIESQQGVTEEEIQETDEAILEEKQKQKDITEQLINPLTNTKVSTDLILDDMKFIREKSTNWASGMEDTVKGQGTINSQFMTTEKVMNEVNANADLWIEENLKTPELVKQINDNLKSYRDSIPSVFTDAGSGGFATPAGARIASGTNLGGRLRESLGLPESPAPPVNPFIVAGLGNPEED